MSSWGKAEDCSEVKDSVFFRMMDPLFDQQPFDVRIRSGADKTTLFRLFLKDFVKSRFGSISKTSKSWPLEF